jgi:hypothetical protein
MVQMKSVEIAPKPAFPWNRRVVVAAVLYRKQKVTKHSAEPT